MKALLTFFVFVIAGCSSSDTMEKDKGQIRQVVNGIIAADNRSDIETVLSFYDNSAILYPPGRSIIRGKAAIRKNYEKIFGNSRLQLVTLIEDIDLQETLAVVSGYNKGTVTTISHSDASTINSNYVMILHKEDSGKWLIQELIWNDYEP